MKKIYIINLITILYYEFIFELIMNLSCTTSSIISRLLFSILMALVFSLIIFMFKEKQRFIINSIIYFLLFFWFGMNAVFYLSLKSFFSPILFGLMDQAVGFIGEALYIIFSYSLVILVFLFPFIMLIIFRKKINYNLSINRKKYIITTALLIGSIFIYNTFLFINKNDTLSNYNLFYKSNNINLSTERLGVIPTFISNINNLFINNSLYIKTNNDNTINVIGGNSNKLNLKYNDEINDDIKEYINNNSGTNKNKYTGFFENKNIVFVVAESYSEVALSKELTPTLYELSHNGFVFNNYYTPYYLSTIAGEFETLTGLYPNIETLNTWKKGTNDFKFGLGNMFKEKGYNTYAYHGHDGYFQNRNIYLNSIGFDNFKACNMNLDINCLSWPESDIEMIDKSYEDYIKSDKPFLAYYMTISGHMNYDFKTNDIAKKNEKLVSDLPYSESVKAYVATQIELDRAVKLLIEKLKENNKLDDTVIILTADHYPYQLTTNEINELSSYKRDKLFEINHNSLIIYNSKMETTYIDKVGMSADVLPTIYNLFNIPYDSRLFIGNDLLSESSGLAIFSNLSWISDKGKYSSGNNQSAIGKEETERINKEVLNKIKFSKNIINYNGYKYIEIEE